ncbi:MAG: hypothetical protein ACIAQZ_15075 [Sedimentisphaeraceae bacterium JB056]
MVETEKIYKLALRIFGLYFAVHLVLRCIALTLIIGLLCLTNIQIEILKPLAMNTSDVISYLLFALLFLKRNKYVDKIYYNSLESEKGNEYTRLALISVKFTILFFVLKIFRNLLRILTILATRCIGRFGKGSDDLFFLQHDLLMLVYKDSIVPLTVLGLVRDISIDLTVAILLIVFVKKIKRFLVPGK